MPDKTTSQGQSCFYRSPGGVNKRGSGKSRDAAFIIMYHADDHLDLSHHVAMLIHAGPVG